MNRGAVALLTTFLMSALLLSGCADDEAFGGSEAIEDALVGQVFLLPENTDRLPDFSVLEPLGTLYTTRLNIPRRSFERGFPGISDRFEWFGLRYEGTLRVRTPGTYTFELTSDDGSRLYVGPERVVDNDFQHDPLTKTGTVTLAAGEHPLVLEYFQGPRFEIALQLFVTPPGGAREVFDSTAVY